MPLFKQLKSPTYLINVARGAVQVEMIYWKHSIRAIYRGLF